MPQPSALAAALLNRCPPSWIPFAPRVVVVAAYRQLNRGRLEGLPRP